MPAPAAFQPETEDHAGKFAVSVAIGIAYLTLFPFRFSLADRVLEKSVYSIELIPFLNRFGELASFGDMVSNVLLFLPYGFFVYPALRMRYGDKAGIWLRAAALGAGLSVTVEALQMFIFHRFTSINDLIMNTTGTLGGAGLSIAFYPTVRRMLNFFILLLRKRPLFLLWTMLLAFQAFVALSPFDLQFQIEHTTDNLQHLRRSISNPSAYLGLISRKILLETLLFGALTATVLGSALSLKDIARLNLRVTATAAMILYYPALLVGQLFLVQSKPTIWFAVAGTVGALAGLTLFGLAHALTQGRPGRANWPGRLQWLLFFMLFAVHLFAPLRPNLFSEWPGGFSGFLHDGFWRPEFEMSTSYLLGHIKLFALAIVPGFALARQAAAAPLRTRILLAGILSIGGGFLVEGLQLVLCAEQTDAAELLDWVAGATTGALLEHWWRLWR